MPTKKLWILPGTAIGHFTVFLIVRIVVFWLFEHRGPRSEDVAISALYGLCMGSLPIQNLIAATDQRLGRPKGSAPS